MTVNSGLNTIYQSLIPCGVRSQRSTSENSIAAQAGRHLHKVAGELRCNPMPCYEYIESLSTGLTIGKSENFLLDLKLLIARIGLKSRIPPDQQLHLE